MVNRAIGNRQRAAAQKTAVQRHGQLSRCPCLTRKFSTFRPSRNKLLGGARPPEAFCQTTNRVKPPSFAVSTSDIGWTDEARHGRP